MKGTAENTCITVRDAAHAATELAAWQDRLVADLQTWTGQGLQIFTVGTRHDGAGVEVGVQDVTQAKDQLLSRSGRSAPLIFVEQGPVRPMTTPSTGSPATPPAVPRPGA